MDYDAYTDQVYVPDRRNKQVDVLAPIITSTALFPREPDRTIRVGAAPQSVAITSDGQFGFIALAGGNVAMLDVPGREIINTIFVGGSPQFIITGLYPPYSAPLRNRPLRNRYRSGAQSSLSSPTRWFSRC